MKNTYSTYYQMMVNNPSKQYEVLAKGFRCFETDNLSEALNDAELKAKFSSFVSILDDGELLAQWSHGVRIQVIR